MRMRSAGRVKRIVFVALAFILAFLARGAALASDVERQIPMTRDAAGSGVTMEISREGTRQTATPFLTLNPPTIRRVEDRIAKETSREGSGRPEAGLSSQSPMPKEITVRNVKSFLKELRASRKEKPVPAVVVTAPEERIGMADTSPR